MILTRVVEAYRAEGDMLVITKYLLDRNVFETMEMAARARARRWAAGWDVCRVSAAADASYEATWRWHCSTRGCGCKCG